MTGACTDPECPAPSHQHLESAYRHGCRSGPAKRAARREEKARRLGMHQPRWIDATGTRRRLEALAAIGWSSKELAARLGITSDALNLYRYESRVNRRSAEKVSALYDELSMIPGASKRTRMAAARKGWVPPLAWSEHGIDDSATVPELDGPADDEPDVHLRDAFLAGRELRWGRLNRADRAALVGWARREGYTCSRVARTLHVSSETLQPYWKQAGS